MKVKARGGLRHCFFLEYSAVIALGFDTPSDALAARAVLGDGWKVSDRKPIALVWEGERSALDALKEKIKGSGFELTIDPCSWAHCRDHCASAEIDGLPHSIDFGPTFTLAIEVADPNQMALL